MNARPTRTRGRRRGGFLLFEIVISLVVLVFISGGVYLILRSTMEAAAEVRRSQLRARAVDAFVELVRRTLRDLPVEASIDGRPNPTENRFELTLRDAPESFGFGSSAIHYGDKKLTVAAQTGGLQRMILRFEPPPEEATSPGSDAGIELPLLGDVRSVEWRFYDVRTTFWRETWEEPGTRPRLIQMTLTLADLPDPIIAQFWVPSKPATNPRNIATGATASGDNPPPTDSPQPSPTPGGTPRVIIRGGIIRTTP